MLQRHQLIRWGRASGVLLFILAVVLFASAIVTHYVANHTLKNQLESSIATSRKLIDTAQDGATLRSVATRQVDDFAEFQASMLDVMSSSILILVSTGFVAMLAGLLSFRSRELAHQLKQTEQVAASDR